MSLPLEDFRGKISARSRVALEARSRATGRSHQDLVREVLDAWADQEIHAASVMQRLLESEGLAGDVPGKARES